MVIKMIQTPFILFVLSGMLGFSRSFNSAVAVASRRAFIAATSTLITTTASAVTSHASSLAVGGKIVYGDESIMTPKAHGTSERPVQDNLRFGVSQRLADRICNYNRHFAEQAGYYYQNSPDFEKLIRESQGEPITFYDSVTGKPLFMAPIGRSAEQFLAESKSHGWPSFRDQETIWENVRVLKNSGETVSVDGTHLGHNLPDRYGNRYCINLVSVAGNPNSTAISSNQNSSTNAM